MTKREAEIEELLYSKLPLKQIATKLDITLRTVKAHCKKVYEANNVQDRIELMALKIKDLNDDIEVHWQNEAGANW